MKRKILVWLCAILMVGIVVYDVQNKVPAKVFADKKIIPMFVMRTNYYFQNASFTTSTEAKNPGGHMGESPTVISMHCIELVRSDPPFFKIFNFIFMRTKNDDGAKSTNNPAVTANEIVNTILKHDEPLTIRENLREMMDAFFLHHEDLTQDFQDGVYSTYKVLSNALGQMDTLNRRIA